MFIYHWKCFLLTSSPICCWSLIILFSRPLLSVMWCWTERASFFSSLSSRRARNLRTALCAVITLQIFCRYCLLQIHERTFFWIVIACNGMWKLMLIDFFFSFIHLCLFLCTDLKAFFKIQQRSKFNINQD